MEDAHIIFVNLIQILSKSYLWRIHLEECTRKEGNFVLMTYFKLGRVAYFNHVGINGYPQKPTF